MTYYVPMRYSRAQALVATRKIPEEVLEFCPIHGTVDDIVGKIERLAKAGLQHTIIANMTPFADLTMIRELAELMVDLLRYIKGR